MLLSIGVLWDLRDLPLDYQAAAIFRPILELQSQKRKRTYRISDSNIGTTMNDFRTNDCHNSDPNLEATTKIQNSDSNRKSDCWKDEAAEIKNSMI